MFRVRDFRGVCDKFGELRVFVLLMLFIMVLIVVVFEMSLVYIVKKVSMDYFIVVKGLNNGKNIFLCCFKNIYINIMIMKRWIVFLGSVFN